MQRRLLIVSNRLPLTIEKTDNLYIPRQSSGGLISAVEAYLNSKGKNNFTEQLWAGVPGVDREVWDKTELDESHYQFMPIFTSQEDYEHYYNGFSNSLLWPLFHYFPSYAAYEPSFFEAYLSVNKVFCETLSATIREDDVVWIHDYHLLPLAGMLREKHPNITIGLFMHIPFPSYELFRVIPKKWQRALLEGMLGADLIGFHTADYVAHFLKSVDIALKTTHDNKYIQWGTRQVQVDAFPISIDFSLFNNAFHQPEIQSLRKKYEALKANKKMLFSVDRLDYTKGILNRLVAYERFLQQYPEYIGNVVFILVVVPSRDAIAKYNEGKKMIDEYIGNLNSSMGSINWQPVIYQYDHLTFEELLALYTTCDVALITPLRDGMNLVAKEFIASRQDQSGVLILSEMAGASAELTDALLINPNDTEEIAESIAIALKLSPEEQESRLNSMQQAIKKYDVNAWAVDFFGELKKVKSLQLKFEVKFLDNFGKAALVNKYESSKKRLLLLDYDGTLVNFSKIPSKAAPNDELLQLLSNLSRDPDNDIYIISGRDSDTLDHWLGHLPIGLVAEHGAKHKYKGERWSNEALAESTTWKEKIEALMKHYVQRSPNSFIERKEFSLAWHYRNADPFLANRRAQDLYEQLVEYTLQMPLDVLNGHKVIEVRNHGVNKGIAAARILEREPYDFVLCVGDDQTDEDMFKVLAHHGGAYTIKVGHQASFARYNLYTPYLVSSLLEMLAGTYAENFN
ncbi:bifunctional alpha,alpha-trehalose-phosphate synthase (UDP-forming)/trehalose-phosphatase [Pedobacter ginsengisoli]|uniref:Bifunctional alpha,alpha-trehalose-phosphate synthase (UDP-forming)/trehalose-phosphatase n=1 Tax=Pedobacter ginsengisoli TaxID=363852 RepID=A0A2D1U9L8_9SPHI|nr:bifunctional alpha,alpha-trehalose-phosphate synthase (UDP-forming)/trehalose-phosphatase [Pedobacter ginsengisoli]ATP58214.1 bifunctional alpha,alpha-trehalose-phosphate synthase (UDP-forming)/trehalose-phosphatase [Pedobacter ginsengisoli]